MADSGREANKGTQKAYGEGEARARAVDAFTYFVKHQKHRTQNRELECVFDGAVDGNVHIEINVKQKHEQKGERGKAKGSVHRASFWGGGSVGKEKDRG